jgi:hypothetical protein
MQPLLLHLEFPHINIKTKDKIPANHRRLANIKEFTFQVFSGINYRHCKPETSNLSQATSYPRAIQALVLNSDQSRSLDDFWIR